MNTNTDRNLSRLDPNFRKKVESFLKVVGNTIFVTEAYRTQERQDYLYSLWRTVRGSIITWTRNSKHTQGLAIDIAFHGDVLYPKDAKVWRDIADIARQYGIAWWYDLWERDKPHFQCDGTKYEEVKNTDVTNKFLHLKGIESKLDGFQLFNEYEDTDMINAGEVKKLISIAFRRYDDMLKGR